MKPVSKLTPEEFFEEASRAEFLVDYRYSSQLSLNRISRLGPRISNGLDEQVEKKIQEIQAQGVELLSRLPTNEVDPGDGIIHQVIEELGEGRIEVGVWIDYGPSDFIERIKELELDGNAKVNRQQQLDVLFDAKVEEEVEKDPEVVELESQLQATKTKQRQLENQLEETKQTLRDQREGRRQAFRYVVDEREI